MPPGFVARPATAPAPQTRTDATEWTASFIERPSNKYSPIDLPNRTLLAQAAKPPCPSLPRRVTGRRSCSRARSCRPLSQTFSARGQGKKASELVGQEGGRYVGDTIAGRPEGTGRYYVPRRPGSLQYVLVYDGEWCQGRRHGHGTHYFANGEVYVGEFENDQRHGHGHMAYANGDVYEGRWEHGRRDGPGRLLNRDADVLFEGTFVNGCREGQGTLLNIARDIKQVSEYTQGQARCGTILSIGSPRLAPLAPTVKDHVALIKAALRAPHVPASKRLDPLRLPAIGVSQPCRVLLDGMIGARRQRRIGGDALRHAQEACGMFSDVQLVMLRHAFVLLCGGDGEGLGVPAAKLKELAVMAELDVTDAVTLDVIAKLAGVAGEALDKQVCFDDFVRVVAHYRTPPVESASAEATVERLVLDSGNALPPRPSTTPAAGARVVA